MKGNQTCWLRSNFINSDMQTCSNCHIWNENTAVEAALRKQLERNKCVGPHSYSCSACSWLYCCCRFPIQTTLCRYVTNPADDCPRTRGPCTTPLCGRHPPWARTGQWTPWPGWWIAAWYASVRMLVWCLSVAKTLFMVILLHAAWFLTTQVSLSKFLPRMLLLAATLVEHYLL